MTELPADVHEAFKEGKFAIRRAAGTFNGVLPYDPEVGPSTRTTWVMNKCALQL